MGIVTLTSRAKSEEICRSRANKQCSQGTLPACVSGPGDCGAVQGHYGHQLPFLDRNHGHAMGYPAIHNPCPMPTPCQKKGLGILKMSATFPSRLGQQFCELLMSGAPGPVTGCRLLRVYVLSCLAGNADFSADYKAVPSSWFQTPGPQQHQRVCFSSATVAKVPRNSSYSCGGLGSLAEAVQGRNQGVA